MLRYACRSLGNKLPHTHRSFSHKYACRSLSDVYTCVWMTSMGIGGVWGAACGAAGAIDENSRDTHNKDVIAKGGWVGCLAIIGGVMGVAGGGIIGITSPISLPMMCYYAYPKKN
jgi:hypothetical protein